MGYERMEKAKKIIKSMGGMILRVVGGAAGFSFFYALICGFAGTNFMKISTDSAVNQIFFQNFKSGFREIFPFCVILLVIVILVNGIRNRELHVIPFLVTACISLSLAWFSGGIEYYRSYQSFVEGFMQSEIVNANAYMDIMGYSDAVKHYKSAVFFDKYIVTWNDNVNMVNCFDGMGRAYTNMEEPLKAKKSFDKALEEVKHCKVQDESFTAYCHVNAAMTCSSLNDNAEALAHAKCASDYYELHEMEEDSYRVSMAYIWLANAYFNDAQYENASQYLEMVIPIFYDSIEWGWGDDTNAKMMAILYKVATLTYESLGDQEHYAEYSKKFDEFAWYRDYEDGDLDDIINHFHWMNR